MTDAGINREEFLGFKKAEDLIAKFEEVFALLLVEPKPTLSPDDVDEDENLVEEDEDGMEEEEEG